MQDGCRTSATRFVLILSKLTFGDRSVCGFILNLGFEDFGVKFIQVHESLYIKMLVYAENMTFILKRKVIMPYQAYDEL